MKKEEFKSLYQLLGAIKYDVLMDLLDAEANSLSTETIDRMKSVLDAIDVLLNWNYIRK